MGMVVQRFEVCLINLDPTVGSEIQKTRPCLVISPNEANRHLRTVIVAPMTTASKPYPTRVPCQFKGKKGLIALDRIRTVDKSRLIRCQGSISLTEQEAILAKLAELFAD